MSGGRDVKRRVPTINVVRNLTEIDIASLSSGLTIAER